MDAIVAAALCIGEPIVYEVKEESKVTESFILNYVVLCIAEKYHKVVALHFGKAVLCAAMDNNRKSFLPSS